MARRTPITGIPTQQTCEPIGIAAASAAGTRRPVGVSAQGMNACPCAQGLVRQGAAEALQDGFAVGDVERILDPVPVATHNQRAGGTLCVGAPAGAAISAETSWRSSRSRSRRRSTSS